jgi:hypothetical protein
VAHELQSVREQGDGIALEFVIVEGIHIKTALFQTIPTGTKYPRPGGGLANNRGLKKKPTS